MSVLSLNNICFSYDRTPVLQNISYDFEEGKVYCISGKSGAGKTTLLSVLSGLAEPNSGSICYDGNDIKKINKYTFRSKYIGVVFQSFNLVTKFTAVENVVLSMEIAGVKGINKKKKAYELLESVGLDAYVGYLHRDRPGRESLALDLMEELRPCFADRFVLTLINNRVLKAGDFDFRESGAVLLTDAGRRTFLQKWQERKKESITHPFLGEKLPWGLVPYVQSLLLARYLRGDLEDYPPFLWK